MTIPFTGEEKIGTIVTAFPGASNLFKELRIDFCCGGNISLREAAVRKRLDAGELLRRLNDSYEQTRLRAVPGAADWRKASIAQLIDHIMGRHHKYLQSELPLLSEFVTKVFRVHGAHQPELAQVHKRFHEMKLELDRHLIQEEELLFPLLLAYGEDPTADRRQRAVLRIRELEADHQGVGDILKELRQLTCDYTLPQGACKTYTLTYHKLVELESDLLEHIHLENNILFARLARPGIVKEVQEMRSEYHVELCFIRTGQPEAAFPELERRVRALFAGVIRCAAERRQREGLDIATVRLSGRHTRWSDEQEVVEHLEQAVQSGELEDLYGYQIRLARS